MELEIPVDVNLMREIRAGSVDADILVDLMVAAGFSHETSVVSFVLTSDDDDQRMETP